MKITKRRKTKQNGSIKHFIKFLIIFYKKSKKSLEFCVYQCHINDSQEKLAKISDEIKGRTEEMDNLRTNKQNLQGQLTTIKDQENSIKGNARLLLEKKESVRLEISEYQARKSFLEKEGNEEIKEKIPEKTQKKKIEGFNKEINGINSKRMSLISEIKSLEGK